jgi:hypothetical protein
MFGRTPWAWLPALVAGWLTAAAATAAADGPPITDAAGLYSPAAVQKATDEIEGIRRAEHKELVIETFKGVPEDRAQAFHGMSRRARDDFLQQWADERAAARHVDGVYVLVCKSPAYAAATLGPDTDEPVFPQRDREQLAEGLTPGGWRRNHDKELLKTVSWFHSVLHHNLRAGGPEDASRIWPGALAVIAGLLLFWGAVTLARHAVELLGRSPADTAPAPRPEAAAAAVTDSGPWHPSAEPTDGVRGDLERRAEEW